MKNWILIFVGLLIGGLIGYFLGQQACPEPGPPCGPCAKAPPTNDDWIVPIDSAEAAKHIEAYGEWAGLSASLMESYHKQVNKTIDSGPKLPESVQLTAAWTFPFRELAEKIECPDSMRAYLAIKDHTNLVRGIPEIELIFVKVDADGNEIPGKNFYNLIRRFPTMCDTTGAIMYEHYLEGVRRGRDTAGRWPDPCNPGS